MTRPQHGPGTAITVINLKGGVGKTHTVWLPTGVCQERGRKLLCVDCDTQANLTRSLTEEGSGGPGLETLFHPAADTEPAELIRTTRTHTWICCRPAANSLASTWPTSMHGSDPTCTRRWCSPQKRREQPAIL